MSFLTPVVFTPLSSVMVCCFGVILPVICFFGGMLQIFFMSRRGAEARREEEVMISFFLINANYLILMNSLNFKLLLSNDFSILLVFLILLVILLRGCLKSIR